MSTLIKILKPLKNHKAGDIVEIDMSTVEGYYWERRLADAKEDNCCEIYSQESEISQDMVQSKSKEKFSNKQSKGE